MLNSKKEKPKWPLERLKSMYFSMHCWKCKKFELPSEEFQENFEETIKSKFSSENFDEISSRTKILDTHKISKNKFFVPKILFQNFLAFKIKDFEVFGNSNYSKFSEQTEYQKICESNIQKIIDVLEVKEMKFKDFNNIINNTEFYKFEKRNLSNFPICKKNWMNKS